MLSTALIRHHLKPLMDEHNFFREGIWSYQCHLMIAKYVIEFTVQRTKLRL